MLTLFNQTRTDTQTSVNTSTVLKNQETHFDYSAFGLRILKEGLVVGEAKTQSGEIIYLGFEKIISNEQLTFWSRYARQSESRQEGMYFVYCFMKQIENNAPLQYPEGESAAFDSEIDYELFLNNIRTTGERRINNDFRNIGAGTSGFSINESDKIRQNFIVYASKRPIDDFKHLQPVRALQTDPTLSFGDIKFQQLESFYLSYRDIIISVGSHTKVGSPSFTHMGIFKNNLILPEGPKYKNISLILHGFAAQVESKIFRASIMVNKPVGSMASILKNRFGLDNIITHEECTPNDYSMLTEKIKAYCDKNGIECHENPLELDHNPVYGGNSILISLDLLAMPYTEARLNAQEQKPTAKPS